MRKKQITEAAIALIFLLLIFGCFNSSEESTSKVSSNKSVTDSNQELSGPVTITDMLGRKVSVSRPIKRIIVNSWDTVGVLIAAAGEPIMDKIVGVGRTKDSEMIQALYAKDYPRLKNLKNIGGGRGATYDPETIISLRPDVVIFNTMGALLDQNMEVVTRVEKVGIPSIILTMANEPITGAQEAFEIAGKLFGTEKRAKQAADFIKAQFAIVTEKKLSQKKNKPTVYQEKGSGSSEEYDITSTSGGWASIIELAGGDNIAKGSVSNNTMIDPEYLISRDPNFIIIAGSLAFGQDIDKGTKVIDDYAARTGWGKLSAVKENRIYELPHGTSKGHTCFYPTLFLAKLFYPEEFPDLDPQAVLKEYFNRFMLLNYDKGVWVAHREESAYE